VPRHWTGHPADVFFFQAEDGIRDFHVTGVQTCALPILLDGYGALVNTQRVAELYTAHVRGEQAPEVRPAALSELVAGEQAYRESSRFETDRAHWAERVAGLDSVTSLDGRSAPRAASNLVVGRPLPADLAERMNTIAATEDSTIAAVLIAAFAGYLGRLTDRSDVVLSLPV